MNATSTKNALPSTPCMTRRSALLSLGCTIVAAGLTGAGTAWGTEAAASGQQAAADEVAVVFSDEGITADGAAVGTDEAAALYTANDVVYYEDRDEYDSGNPYGEGGDDERHSAEDAAAVTVLHIAQAGTYRLSGSISAGQVWVDLGEDASTDESAKVTLVLDGLDITCEVAPAIVFHNVYECDGDWSAETATKDVDTSAAGAVVVIADGSVNNVTGSHVARIYKDKAEQKKLWKIDGAFYSYVSMNIEGGDDGTGVLNIVADNEGLDSELHLTINGGNISIQSGDDGINTNEDGVSVTCVNGGTLHIVAGLGSEGDGVDSNGFLVINGGTVIAMANPASDSGLDSDMGSYINGGTVVALGSTMDWAESDSDQVTMNLQFSGQQDAGDAIVVCDEDGNVVFAYDPSEDETASGNTRTYQGAVLSCANFEVGQTYSVYVGGTVAGQETQGVYEVDTVTGYADGVQQSHTGTDVQGGPGGGMGPGGMGDGGPGQGGPGGDMQPPSGDAGQGGLQGDGGEPPSKPEGEAGQGGPGENGGQEPPSRPEGDGDSNGGAPQGGETASADSSTGTGAAAGSEVGDGASTDKGTAPQAPADSQAPGDASASGNPQANAGESADASTSTDETSTAEASTGFYMQDKVNCFSGVAAAQ